MSTVAEFVALFLLSTLADTIVALCHCFETMLGYVTVPIVGLFAEINYFYDLLKAPALA